MRWGLRVLHGTEKKKRSLQKQYYFFTEIGTKLKKVFSLLSARHIVRKENKIYTKHSKLISKLVEHLSFATVSRHKYLSERCFDVECREYKVSALFFT